MRRRGVASSGAIAALLLLGCATAPTPRPMTQPRLEALIRAHGSEVEARGGVVEFSFGGVRMACVSDPQHDRMRIIAPIAREADVGDPQRRAALVANFHSALDARYASSRGILYAAFLHPLSPLSEGELLSSLQQVANLALTFGGAYSSGDLFFGGGLEEE